jgi:hypothetical protein
MKLTKEVLVSKPTRVLKTSKHKTHLAPMPFMRRINRGVGQRLEHHHPLIKLTGKHDGTGTALSTKPNAGEHVTPPGTRKRPAQLTMALKNGAYTGQRSDDIFEMCGLGRAEGGIRSEVFTVLVRSSKSNAADSNAKANGNCRELQIPISPPGTATASGKVCSETHRPRFIYTQGTFLIIGICRKA